jgi:hypothetical protein
MSLAAALDAIKDSLALGLPTRVVRRGLPADPANLSRTDRLAGVVCVVATGGGDFANYMGREGQLGAAGVSLVCFIQVEEASTEPQDIEDAELALLDELLAWTSDPGDIDPADRALPEGFTLSKQIEHPYGWLVFQLDVGF